MIDADGYVTEGSSSNAWIVSKEGELITRPATHDILSGITRKAIIEIASLKNLKIIERPFSPEEAVNSSEAFISSASTLVTPVGSLDGKPIGDGQIGPVAATMRQAYFQRVEANAE
jgi:D-alanine transaminase